MQELHQLEVTTFKHPTWCKSCGEFIWGLWNQGLCCKGCHMTLHLQCKEQILLPCVTAQFTSLNQIFQEHCFLKCFCWGPVKCIGCNKLMFYGIQVACRKCNQLAHAYCAQVSKLPSCVGEQIQNMQLISDVSNHVDPESIVPSRKRIFDKSLELVSENQNSKNNLGLRSNLTLFDSWLFINDATDSEAIPKELWFLILQYCDFVDLCRMAQVSKYLEQTCSSPDLWLPMVQQAGYGSYLHPNISDFKLFYQLLLPRPCTFCKRMVIPIRDCQTPKCTAHHGHMKLERISLDTSGLEYSAPVIIDGIQFLGPYVSSRSVWSCCGQTTWENRDCSCSFHEFKVNHLFIPEIVKKKLVEMASISTALVDIGRFFVALPLLVGFCLVGCGVRAGAEFLLYQKD